MQVLVEMELMDSVVGDLVPEARKKAAKLIQMVMESGKVQAGGLVVGRRGGFFLIDADDPEELGMLFSPGLDLFEIKINLVAPFEHLPKMFKRMEELGF
jgi:hypothetical protein